MKDEIYDIETEVLYSKPSRKIQIRDKLPSILLVLLVLTAFVCLVALSFFLIKVFFKVLGYLVIAGLLFYLGRKLYELAR